MPCKTDKFNTPLQVAFQSVLVIDDDEFSHVLLRRALDELGVTDVHVATDGLDALRVLQSLPSRPDFLICDVFMPGMDGIEFILALAKMPYEGSLILITGGDVRMLEVANHIATVSNLKVLGTLTKPFLVGDLRKLMNF